MHSSKLGLANTSPLSLVMLDAPMPLQQRALQTAAARGQFEQLLCMLQAMLSKSMYDASSDGCR